MTDFLTPEQRSLQMSKIRGKNTKAELVVFRYLRKRGVYFQKHYKRAQGSPDVALPRKKRAVFIDGDFWHGKTIDRVMERGPDDYWTKKILRNMERDQEQEVTLREAGWQILRIWEKDLMRKRTQVDTLEKIVSFLTAMDTGEVRHNPLGHDN